MIAGLEKAMAHRIWFVPQYMVWGLPGFDDLDMLTLETVGSTDNILFGQATFGDATQQVSYAELCDHRGNLLPASLAAPRVIPRSRESSPVFVVGDETSTTFKIARDPNATGPVSADFLILEMNL